MILQQSCSVSGHNASYWIVIPCKGCWRWKHTTTCCPARGHQSGSNQFPIVVMAMKHSDIVTNSSRCLHNAVLTSSDCIKIIKQLFLPHIAGCPPYRSIWGGWWFLHSFFLGGGCTCKTIHMFTQESGAFEAKSSSGTKWTSGLRFVTHLIEQGCFCLEQTGYFEQLGNGWGKVEEFWLLGNPVLGDSAPPGWKSSRSQCPWCCTRDKQSRSKIMRCTCMYVNCGCPTFQLLVL